MLYKLVMPFTYASSMAAFCSFNEFDAFEKTLIRQYLPGTVVVAYPGSPGIFCFDSLSSAFEFSRRTTTLFHLLEVLPIGKPRKINRIYGAYWKMAKWLTNDLFWQPESTPPHGTVVVPAVYVKGLFNEDD